MRLPDRLSALFVCLLLFMASNPLALAQKRKTPELVPAPPPVVTREITVSAGDSVVVPLGIHGSRSRQLEFLVRVRPKMGKLSKITITGANSATVTYTAPADTEATEDKFAYAVRSGEGVSAPGVVTIKLVPAPVMPGKLEVPEKLAFPATIIGKETSANFEISNSGGSPVSGEVTVSSPWRLEGSASYQLAPKGHVAMRLIFSPEKSGALAGDVTFGPNPRKVMSLTGEGKSPIEVRPARVKLVASDRGQTRAASLEVENLSDEPQTISVGTDARLLTEKLLEVAPRAKVQLPIFAEPGDGTTFQEVVRLSAGDWKQDIPVEVEALMQRLKLSVEPSAVLRGAPGQAAEFAVWVENEGGRPLSTKLAAAAPFHIAEPIVALAAGEKKQIKVTSDAVPEGEHTVEVTAENESLIRRIKVQFVAAPDPSAKPALVRPAMPAVARAEVPREAPAEGPSDFERPPVAINTSPQLADHPNALNLPPEGVTWERATLVWPKEMGPRTGFQVQERKLSLSPKKELSVNWVRMSNVTFREEGGTNQAELTGLQPGKLYTVRMVANGQTLFTTQFSTKVKPPLLPFGWETMVVAGLFAVLGWIGWRKWKTRQRSSGW